MKGSQGTLERMFVVEPTVLLTLLIERGCSGLGEILLCLRSMKVPQLITK